MQIQAERPLVSRADVEAFQRDGAVCVRGAIPPEWISRLRDATEEILANPGPGDRTHRNPDGTPSRFRTARLMWERHPVFAALMFDSPLAALAGELMEASKVNVFHDLLFVKEPGAASDVTPWHQDETYQPVLGWQVCSSWLPLDSVDQSTGAVSFIKGSHRWGKRFGPTAVSSEDAGEWAGNTDEPMPDIEANRDSYEFLTWDTEPGDLVFHHALTVHGAPGNTSAERRRRAIASRWAGEDARWAPRPGTMRFLREVPLQDGDVLDSENFPVAWRRS